MAKKKVAEKYIGLEIVISPSHTLVFSEYMSDSDYEFALKHFPRFFEEPKKAKKKNDKD